MFKIHQISLRYGASSTSGGSHGSIKALLLNLPPETRAEAADNRNPAAAALIRNSEAGAFFHGEDVACKIRQLYGDSTKFDFGPYIGKMDVVFVPGGHDYEIVKSDTLNALKLARPGGLIVWHDFANYGDYNDVTRAILDLLPPSEIIQIDNTQLAVYWNGQPAPAHRPVALAAVASECASRQAIPTQSQGHRL